MVILEVIMQLARGYEQSHQLHLLHIRYTHRHTHLLYDCVSVINKQINNLSPVAAYVNWTAIVNNLGTHTLKEE